jgi:hypothetical protein
MLQRHDLANRKGKLVERAYRDVENEVILARQTARGVRDNSEDDNERLNEILVYIRTSSAIQSLVHEEETPPASDYHEPTPARKAGGYHVNHMGEASHLDEGEEGYEYNQTAGVAEALMEAAQRKESPTQLNEELIDQEVMDKGKYPIALVHTAMAVSIAQEEPGKPLIHCTWCGARTCQSVLVKGNQCQLVWTNTRTGAALLSTRKFGLLKHTSEVAFTAAFQEAMEHGMLQGAAQKDILEFVELVDQSVKFYVERGHAYQESKRSNTNPYRPPQDARGGYHNGSAYPTQPPARMYNGGGGPNTNASRFQAYVPTGQPTYRI